MGFSGVEAGDFSEFDAQLHAGKYDWVVMLDYIEHTYFPFDDIIKAAVLLKPGGLLLAKTFLEELDVKRAYMLPPCHSHHFFGAVLYRMITEAGLSVKYWYIELEWQQVQIIAERNESE
jgi:2-polyprenyl-3-methyl-5-hydroxy-6-metoxy-1,4-benzoquinol methylase